MSALQSRHRTHAERRGITGKPKAPKKLGKPYTPRVPDEPPTLEDLSKEQLIELIRARMWPLPTSAQIAYFIWKATHDEGMRYMDESLKDPPVAPPPDASIEERFGYLDETRKRNNLFERGYRLCSWADAYYKKFLSG